MAFSIILLFSTGALALLCIALLILYLQSNSLLNQKTERDATEQLFLDALLKDTVDSIYLKDRSSRMVLTNDAFRQHIRRKPEDIYGFTDVDFYGKDFGEITIAEETQIINTGIPLIGVVEERFSKEGTNFHVLTTKVPVYKNDEIVGILGITRAFDRFAQQQEELTHIATHDALTGLINRAEIMNLLKNILLQREPIALLFIDIDNFKEINDRYGHEVGDKALQLTAKRMQSIIRKNDQVGRFGGDEFVIILRRISEKKDAAAAARNLIQELQKPSVISGNQVFCHVSIGIACTRAHAAVDIQSSEQLIRSADHAMYEVKKRGKGGYAFYVDAIVEEQNQPKVFPE